MNAQETQINYFLKIILSPLVFLPAGVGIGALAAGILGGGLMWFVLGLGGLAAAGALAMLKWMFLVSRKGPEIIEELALGSGQSDFAYFRQLERRLRTDQDPRTEVLLRQLRQLKQRLERPRVAPSGNKPDPLEEVREQADHLCRSCLASLGRTADLWDLAKDMTTDEARQQALKEREDLLAEIGRSAAHLGATLDQLQLADVEHGPQAEDLTRMSGELKMGLQVARQIEERLAEFDRRFRERPAGP